MRLLAKRLRAVNDRSRAETGAKLTRIVMILTMMAFATSSPSFAGDAPTILAGMMTSNFLVTADESFEPDPKLPTLTGKTFYVGNLAGGIGPRVAQEPAEPMDVCINEVAFDAAVDAELYVAYDAEPRWIPAKAIDGDQARILEIARGRAAAEGAVADRVSLGSIHEVDIIPGGSPELIVEVKKAIAEELDDFAGEVGDYDGLLILEQAAGGPRLLAAVGNPIHDLDHVRNGYRLVAIAKNPHDGQTDIFVYQPYYEGGAMVRYRFTDQKLAEVDSAWCGV